VTATGNRIVTWARRKEIRYEFHVMESGAINAFALPGGQVFVTRGMLNFLKDGDELAAVMGHEIAHVDLRHCIERYQYQMALGKLGEAVDVVRRIIEMGYSQSQESEADEAGWRMAVDAGYDARAAETVFARMAKEFGERSKKQATTPVGEVTGSVAGLVTGYFQSHPPSADRAERLRRLRERR
jgi:predicted Zn-dependent protease